MEAESQKAAEKYRELLSQNERLHGQAEQLTSQLKVLQRQAQGDDDDNLSSISGFSTTEKTAEELWDIIRYCIVCACVRACIPTTITCKVPVYLDLIPCLMSNIVLKAILKDFQKNDYL